MFSFMRRSTAISLFSLVVAGIVAGCTTPPMATAAVTPAPAPVTAQSAATPPATTQPATTQSATTQSEAAMRFQRPASPVVNADGTVTFRAFAPNAKVVELWGDWPKPNGGPMTKDEKGVWTATFTVPKGYWGYMFKFDGQYAADRANPNWKTSREVTTSVLDLPGDLPWDRKAGVAHGVVHLHDYESTSLNRTRRLRVYTPAGYDAEAAKKYPVFYLLHGSGDNEAVWTDFGRANVILDNLIASGAAQPMIVVMTDGHAVGGGQADSRDKNVDAYATELLGQVIPMIDSLYRTKTDADSRAIAGLSMGGNQALIIGLHHPELFQWIGGMSSAIRNPERDLGDVLMPSDHKPAATFKLVWVSCGVEDQFLKTNRHLHEVLDQAKVPSDYNETPGKHAWPVWRNNLVTLAPKLFQAVR